MYRHQHAALAGRIPNNNRFLFNKIRKVLRISKVIIYKKIYENLIESNALMLEVDEIKKYGRRNNKTGILCNMTDGGDGVSGRKMNAKTYEKLKLSYLNNKEERDRVSIKNLKLATAANVGQRKLLEYHNEIFELYKTKSTIQISQILKISLPAVLRYLKEQGWYIHFKNQQSTTEETRQKMKISNIGKRSVPVLQYDLDGHFIRRFDSIKEAVFSFSTNENRIVSICACCRGNQKTAYGYKWKYANDKT